MEKQLIGEIEELKNGLAEKNANLKNYKKQIILLEVCLLILFLTKIFSKNWNNFIGYKMKT